MDGQSAPTRWERAYLTFEKPAQEIRKFERRLRRLGADGWRRSLSVVEVCCGRGSALEAWRRLGYTAVYGVDLSQALIARGAKRDGFVIGDARALPLATGSFDITSVQGGLHHLSDLGDVERMMTEMTRVTKPDGRVVVIEPWLTPWLRLAHFVSERPLARRVSRRVDAFAIMTEEELTTYTAWLSAPDEVLALMRRHVIPVKLEIRRGKITLIGKPAPRRR